MKIVNKVAESFTILPFKIAKVDYELIYYSIGGAND